MPKEHEKVHMEIDTKQKTGQKSFLWCTSNNNGRVFVLTITVSVCCGYRGLWWWWMLVNDVEFEEKDRF